MSQVTELKINLSRGKTSTSGEYSVAAIMIGWHTDDGDTIKASKIISARKEKIGEQVSALVERLVSELPQD